MRIALPSLSGLICLTTCGLATGATSMLPPGLAPALEAARYAIEAHDGGYLAHNPSNRQRIAFRDGGLTVSALPAPPAKPAPPAGSAAQPVANSAPNPAPDWRWGLRLQSYGTPQAVEPVADAEVQVNGSRLEYRRGPITEWYENRPAGLEQGFTLERPPTPADSALVLVLTVQGDLQPDWQTPGQALRFLTNDGHEALSYSHLEVVDANGRSLPSYLALAEPQRLEIHVDAAGASWPIVVDPLIANEQAKLVPDDAAAGQFFGLSVAVSGDTAVVGWNNPGSSNGKGAYVFTRNDGAWTQREMLSAFVDAPSTFGSPVALSGDTALVADPADDGYRGKVYVYTVTGTSGNSGPDTALVAGDADLGDNFGRSIALSGNIALIGANGDDEQGLNAGAVYVFTRTGETWTQVAKLTAADARAGDLFGSAVALAGNTALVGAQWADRPPPPGIGIPPEDENSGAAYVFTRRGETWTQQAKLTASNGAPSDYFGEAVALAGDTAMIGVQYADGAVLTAGAAYVFTRSGDIWTEQPAIIADDGAPNDRFGDSVDLSGNTALIGARVSDSLAEASGSAYVFSRIDGDWIQQDKLTASDAHADQTFGHAVALFGDTALIGATGDNNGGALPNAGAAYAFMLSGLEPVFADVPSSHWAFDNVTAIYDANITAGCGNGFYCPDNTVTREQMAAFLVRTVWGEPPTNACAGVAPFSDVDPAGWACGYIQRLAALGLTTGCGAGNYCPSALVSREQMAAFLVRALEGEPAANSCASGAPFTDVDAGGWACPYIQRLKALGITNGCGNGNYCPDANVQRDEMAAFLARAFLGL